MARIDVVDPASGVTVSVTEESKLAALWRRPEVPEPEEAPKRRPGRPKKSDSE